MRHTAVLFVCWLLAVSGCAGQLFTGDELFRTSTEAKNQIGESRMSGTSLFSDAGRANAPAVIVMDPPADASDRAVAALDMRVVPDGLRADQRFRTMAGEEARLRVEEQSDGEFAAGLKRALKGEGPRGTAGDPVLLDRSGRIWAVQAPRGTIPKRLHQSKAVNKVLQTYAATLGVKSDTGQSYEKQRLNKDDIEELVKVTLPYLGVGKDGEIAPAATDEDDKRTEIFNRITRYLVVYTRGKFVDRQGKKLDKPEIKDKKISDDVLTGAISVIIEAITDSCLPIPVFYEMDGGKKKWITASGGDAEPTAGVLDKTLEVDLSSAPTNITKAEIRLIQYLGQGAGLTGHAFAGFLIRSLGKLDVGQFALAGISIGDNQIIAKTVDAIFETGSRRLTEANAYKYLHETTEAHRPQWLRQLLALINQVYDKTEDQ